MTKETKRLERAERLLRGLAGICEAVEGQQVRASGLTRQELTGAVPVSLHAFMRGLRAEINGYFTEN